jgi:hypothetical protein
MELQQRIVNIIENYSPELAAEEILLLFGVNSNAIADLNHITINAAMNIQGLTDCEPQIQEECSKIINAVRNFSNHYH